MLSCRDFCEHASDLIDGQAPWRFRVVARVHRALCRHCARYLEQLRLTRAVLTRACPQSPPVDGERILSEIERRSAGS